LDAELKREEFRILVDRPAIKVIESRVVQASPRARAEKPGLDMHQGYAQSDFFRLARAAPHRGRKIVALRVGNAAGRLQAGPRALIAQRDIPHVVFSPRRRPFEARDRWR